MITNHNQNMKAGVANSSDNSTTFNLVGMAKWCILQRETDSE
jgi:hypothetical protein